MWEQMAYVVEVCADGSEMRPLLQRQQHAAMSHCSYTDPPHENHAKQVGSVNHHLLLWSIKELYWSKFFISVWEIERSERKKDNSDVGVGVSYGVASFSSWSKSICNPKPGIARIRGPPTSFQRWTPWTNGRGQCRHSSITPALGGLTSEFSCDPGYGLRFKPLRKRDPVEDGKKEKGSASFCKL